LKLETFNEVVSNPASRPEDPEPGRYVVVSVTDTGCGMDEQTLGKAFEPFFTTKAVGQGSGLGLAQVFGFAKQSGGGVRIDSQVNVGTTVKVYLPKIQGVASRLEQGALPVADASATDASTVLLVDDDDAVREVTANMLESFGLTVVQSRNGIEALTRISPTIDLLVTDYAMPGMTGGELATLIRKVDPVLPVLFITGYADTDVLGLSNATVVQKPFSEQTLKEKIWLVLAQRG